MPSISVRAVAGRVARQWPRGPFIPHDRYVLVDETPYIRRLLNYHGDIELEPKPVAKAEAKAKAAEEPTPPVTETKAK